MGAELRQKRKEAGLSTHKLGSLLGRSHTHVSRWENGKLTPSEADTSAVLTHPVSPVLNGTDLSNSRATPLTPIGWLQGLIDSSLR
ncbi:helix-turn-helix domain-containing protein [Saccharopolyspora sp. NPDC000359]|uniref:helix-turn-helix transcriptional regulator n=1 Tax=Saccharopolyspora sp. NPDC000359 TaxID=3154251 RepID=UPI00332586DA